MEYEIEDEPQTVEGPEESTRDGGLIEDPVSLINQSERFGGEDLGPSQTSPV